MRGTETARAEGWRAASREAEGTGERAKARNMAGAEGDDEEVGGRKGARCLP